MRFIFMVLHALFRRLRAARVDCPGKRLLLLHVFDRADQGERLLDTLDDTWRRAGRIDLIAGTDLAMRTLGSHARLRHKRHSERRWWPTGHVQSEIMLKACHRHLQNNKTLNVMSHFQSMHQ